MAAGKRVKKQNFGQRRVPHLYNLCHDGARILNISLETTKFCGARGICDET